MKIELAGRYIQIEIEKNSAFLQRALNFAYKHFSRAYRLSSSILILDDGERFKKDYFLNWAFHVAMQHDRLPNSDNSDKGSNKGHTKAQKADAKGGVLLTKAEILEHSHLPIRIKITDVKGLLEFVEVSMHVISTKQVSLQLNHPNKLARRYLLSLFSDYVIAHDGMQIFLDSTKQDFWEKLVTTLSQRVIHNVILDFDYETFRAHNAFEATEGFLTRDERRLRRSFRTLGCHYTDSFDTVKSRYIQLARLYHPDTVYGKDEKIIQSYTEKFRSVQEAFENIKQSFEHVA